MAAEIEVQSKGEMAIINNRKAKIETENEQNELRAMIQNLYDRLEKVEKEI